MKKSPDIRTETLVKLIIYVALIALAISIVIPFICVFIASIKENESFYNYPWLLPEGFHWKYFIEAFRDDEMGDYLINSVMVTTLSLFFLLIVALPAAYVLSRFEFWGSRFLNSFVKAG